MSIGMLGIEARDLTYLVHLVHARNKSGFA